MKIKLQYFKEYRVYIMHTLRYPYQWSDYGGFMKNLGLNTPYRLIMFKIINIHINGTVK